MNYPKFEVQCNNAKFFFSDLLTWRQAIESLLPSHPDLVIVAMQCLVSDLFSEMCHYSQVQSICTANIRDIFMLSFQFCSLFFLNILTTCNYFCYIRGDKFDKIYLLIVITIILTEAIRSWSLGVCVPPDPVLSLLVDFRNCVLPTVAARHGDLQMSNFSKLWPSSFSENPSISVTISHEFPFFLAIFLLYDYFFQ